MSNATKLRGEIQSRRLPPIEWLSTFRPACVVAAGIILASYAPRAVPFGISIILLIAGAALLPVSLVVLSRIENFPWTTFVKVFKWGLLAYLVVSEMIELAFARDHVRGPSLVTVTRRLVIFALAVSLTAAFTTTRFSETE